ncbi:hypothetical protein GKZ89_09525 [Bacillus mangrovi]|uniref:Tetratricopeptide repeat protein n=1 Tax=Metabacillus mangrovi TaxID=1491830 RepID=A0A7X2S4U6_9BACI|nr:hypothetical protein [Metabacillus mangrovi]MTH53642.1 hypothetical protein [Metabacillus mangrovi]
MSGHIEYASVAQNGEKPLQLRLKRLAFYNRMRIAEADHPEKGTFYLFFYQNQFLTAKQGAPKKGSSLSRAFRKGAVLEAPHPLIDAHFSNPQTYQLKTVTQLFKSLAKQMTPQETVYILSHFDSYVQKEKLTEIAKTFFFQYRRSGQFRLAHQLLMTLLSFDSKNLWAHELSQHMNFLKYRLIYEAGYKEMKAADPLYAEMLCRKQKKTEPAFKRLQVLYAEQGRWMDAAALYIHYFKQEEEPSTAYYDQFAALLAERFNARERAIILWDSCRGLVKDSKAGRDLMDALLTDGRREDAVAVLIASEGRDLEQLHTLLTAPDLDYEKVDTEQLQRFLSELEDRKACTRLLRGIVPELLKARSFHDVLEWLQPISSPVTENFRKMETYQDDPEQQLELGRLYHEVKQYQKAIDCFSWEMELRPDSPEPVQWLSKTYKEMGMPQEAKAYMSVLHTMQKASSS